MIAARLVTNRKTSWLVFDCHLGITKLRALPTANKKEGNTKSVGVKPFHSACNNKEKVAPPSPGVFTIIIKQMVSPRKTSRAKKRGGVCIIVFF